MPTIRTRDEQPWDPGHGLPVITPQGVSLSAKQLLQVEQLAARGGVALRSGLQPRSGKRIREYFGAARTASGAGVFADWAERIPLRFPVATTRWRLGANNRINTDGSVLTSPWSVGNIYFGSPAPVTADRPNGAWEAVPVKVLDGGAVPTDGSNWFSAWCDDPTKQFPKLGTRMVGLTMSSPGGGSGQAVTQVKRGFRFGSAGAAASIAQVAATGYNGNTLALDKFIEYEFDSGEQIGLYVGDSFTDGWNPGEDGGNNVVQDWETWCGQVGLRTQTPWINAGIYGARENAFADANAFGFKRLDLTTVPDFAVVQLANNSILQSYTLAQIKTNYAAVIATLRGFGIKRLFLVTSPPANYASGADAKEVVRLGVNDWLRQLPLGVAGCFDLDRAVRSEANRLVIHPDYVASDNTHVKRAGNAHFANGVQIL